MSDLQLTLIGLGLLLVIAVVIYNWRQEKKLRQNITHGFATPEADVLVDGPEPFADTLVDDVTLGEVRKVTPSETVEPQKTEPVAAPVMSDTPDNAASESVSSEPAQPEPTPLESTPVKSTALQNDAPEINIEEEVAAEPAVETPVSPAVEEAPVAEPVTEMPTLPDAIHPIVDLTALLSSASPIRGHMVNTMLQEALKDADVMVYGLGQAGSWQQMNALTSESATFKAIACSLQLANRNGPVAKAVINKFQFSVENAGVELNANVAWQGEGDATQRAQALDKFCIDVDQLVSVHLVQGEAAIHGTKFRGLAEANDMQLKDGQFYYFGENETDLPLFTLSNADKQAFTADSLRLNVVKGATFQIEVPKLINCEQTFNQMTLVAQQMANSLGATMVDDNQRPLGDVQIDKIRQQLKVIHSAMVEHGIVPGSAVSLRLFN